MKFLLEMGPLILFFAVNYGWGLIPATGALIAATVVSLAVSWVVSRRIPKAPLIAGAFVLLFGGLTIIFEDEMFIKIKPTAVNLLFGVGLLGGLAFGRIFLRDLFEQAFKLDDEGWRKLTIRWGIFFFCMAALNEGVWRTVDTDTWVAFKAFGLVPLSILFAVAQTPLILKHNIDEDEGDDGSGETKTAA
jgi:intracellular septation protein